MSDNTAKAAAVYAKECARLREENESLRTQRDELAAALRIAQKLLDGTGDGSMATQVAGRIAVHAALAKLGVKP